MQSDDASFEVSICDKTDTVAFDITQDENGVLRIGDTIIPQKKLLFESEEGAVEIPWSDDFYDRTLEFYVADIAETTATDENTHSYHKIRFTRKNRYKDYMWVHEISLYSNGEDIDTLYILNIGRRDIDGLNCITVFITNGATGTHYTNFHPKIYKIYEIIE